MTLKQTVLDNCLNFQPNPNGWVWQKTKKQYRRQLFPHTTLCIDPMFFFKGYLAQMSPHVRILYKPYQKLYKKIGFPNNFDYCWNYLIGDYYFKKYPHTIKVWDELPPNSRESWHSIVALPTLLQDMIDRSNEIFETELDLSNEKAFAKSMVLAANDPRLDDPRYSKNVGILNQGLLNLMQGNVDYLYMMQDRFKQRGGLHLKYVPIIIKLVEEHGIDDLLEGVV